MAVVGIVRGACPSQRGSRHSAAHRYHAPTHTPSNAHRLQAPHVDKQAVGGILWLCIYAHGNIRDCGLHALQREHECTKKHDAPPARTAARSLVARFCVPFLRPLTLSSGSFSVWPSGILSTANSSFCTSGSHAPSAAEGSSGAISAIADLADAGDMGDVWQR